MIEVRITLTGKVLPWWDRRIFFTEFRILGGVTAWQMTQRVRQYGEHIAELRHATMLEF